MVADALPKADLARTRAVVVGSVEYFIVPENRGVCLVGVPGGFACGRPPEIRRMPVVLNTLCVRDAPGHARMAGLVPDTLSRIGVVSEGGARRGVGLREGIFDALVPKDPLPITILVAYNDGSTTSIPAGVPRDSQNVRC